MLLRELYAKKGGTADYLRPLGTEDLFYSKFRKENGNEQEEAGICSSYYL